MHYLLLSLDAAGNWPPEQALLRALADRGHALSVVSAETHRPQVEEVGATFEAYRCVGKTPPPDDPSMNPLEYVARTMLLNTEYRDELLDATARLEPDVLLVDQMLWSAIAAAESLPTPTAVLWHTIYGGWTDMRRLPPFLVDMLNAQRRDLGLPDVADVQQHAERAGAVLAFTEAKFDLAPDPLPANLHCVGPLACLPDVPMPEDDPRPLVLVSYSTSFMDQVSVLQRVSDALSELPVRGLLTLGPAIAREQIRVPDNVVAESFVAHAAVLAQTDLLITHAGHGTTMAGVTAGVPLLCTPMGRDQHHVGACVERTGLGRVISQDASVTKLREAIQTMLADRALKTHCREFAEGIDLPAGLARAIEVLERLPA